MGLFDEEMTQRTIHIYGFTGDSIKLPITLGEEHISSTRIAEFKVIDQLPVTMLLSEGLSKRDAGGDLYLSLINEISYAHGG